MSLDVTDEGSLRAEIKRAGDLARTVLSRLDSLTDDVADLKRQLGSTPVHVRGKTEGIRFYFGKSHLERKPFSLSMSGALEGKLSMSPVRAAILLVGLVDLQDRLEGNNGTSNFTASVMGTLRRLEARALADSDLSESIRVALYRFEQFLIDTPEFRKGRRRISYNSDAQHLDLVSDASALRIEVTSDDPLISELIGELSTTSPLERLRRTKAMYIPPGPRGLERILLEMYDHPGTVTVRSLYLRLSSLSAPRKFLESSNCSDKVLRRYDLALEGMKSGRVKLLEIVRHNNLLDLIRKDPTRSSPYDPEVRSHNEITEHLDHLMWRVKSLPGYTLAITRSDFPMYLITYELKHGDTEEHISLCCRNIQEMPAGGDLLGDLAVYCLHDRIVTEVLSAYTIDGTLKHPATVSERGAVLEELAAIREKHLSSEGSRPRKGRSAS